MRIVREDHPMGSQIRLNEGDQQDKYHPYVTPTATASVAGMDVSGYQGNVNWSAAYANGARFAFVKRPKAPATGIPISRSSTTARTTSA